MRHLVLFAHADPQVAPKYRTALAPVGDVDLVFVNATGGGFSSAYSSLGQQLRAPDGRILPRLKAKYIPTSLAGRKYDTTTLVTFSAGYALAREILKSTADRDAIDALVMLDSLHAGFDGDGTAGDVQLSGFLDFALLAKDGRKVFHIGHSDVKTPQPGQKGAFASTTQTAAELVRLAGGTGGKFEVQAFDVEKRDHDEHVAALQGWGAGFVADAMRVLLDEGPATDPAPPPPRPTPTDFASAVLDAASTDLTASLKEWGHNAGPEVERLYLTPLGLPPGSNYCAAAVTSWAGAAEATTGRVTAIAGGPGAQAIMGQAKAAGLWTPKGAALKASLRPGHFLVWDRSNPAGSGWQGHIGVVVDVGDGVAWTIEGNADRVVAPDGRIFAVCMVERRLDDARLFGAGRWE